MSESAIDFSFSFFPQPNAAELVSHMTREKIDGGNHQYPTVTHVISDW